MNDAVSSLLIRQMDRAEARQRVLAHNLANYGTPGYKAKGPSFEGELTKAGAKDAAGRGAAGAPGAAEAEAGQEAGAALAGTAESLEMQMAKLASNAGRFSALARILTIRERAYENAIKGR